MPRRIHFFDEPDRFVTGTIGEPGNRTFFLQARDGARVVSVTIEKVQVAVLADRLAALLAELQRRGLAEVPEDAAETDGGPLDEPLNEAFRAGTLSLGWDVDSERVVIEAREQTDEDEEETEEEAAEAAFSTTDDAADGPDLFRVRLEAGAARSFIERAVQVLASGRPPCPLCGQPLDPQGHLCPRRNGKFLN